MPIPPWMRTGTALFTTLSLQSRPCGTVESSCPAAARIRGPSDLWLCAVVSAG